MNFNEPPTFKANSTLPQWGERPPGPAPGYNPGPGGGPMPMAWGQPGGFVPPYGGPFPPGPGGQPPPPGTMWGPPGGNFPPPPVYNPPVPHSQALPVPASDGLMIVLQGHVPPSANRFHINMMVGGADENCPVAFHLNPRFEGTDQVVRNSCLGGWGEEEREGAFPLIQGSDFEVIVLFTPSCFKVAFNGAHYCDFAYRSRMEEVTHVSVAGDVAIRCLMFKPPARGMNPPTGGPPMGGPMGGPPMGGPMGGPPMGGPMGGPPMGAIGQPFPISYNLQMPHEVKIQGGLVEGRKIYISGKPTMEDRFEINLCYHDSHTKDIALHFNPRFDEGCVVRNSMTGSYWDQEEREQPNFPFKQDQHFDLLIICQSDKFLVHVNGTHFCEFRHRLQDLASIRTLFINEGVVLSHVSVL